MPLQSKVQLKKKKDPSTLILEVSNPKIHFSVFLKDRLYTYISYSVLFIYQLFCDTTLYGTCIYFQF